MDAPVPSPPPPAPRTCVRRLSQRPETAVQIFLGNTIGDILVEAFERHVPEAPYVGSIVHPRLSNGAQMLGEARRYHARCEARIVLPVLCAKACMKTKVR
jgi:hypothetical protein